MIQKLLDGYAQRQPPLTSTSGRVDESSSPTIVDQVRLPQAGTEQQAPRRTREVVSKVTNMRTRDALSNEYAGVVRRNMHLRPRTVPGPASAFSVEVARVIAVMAAGAAWFFAGIPVAPAVRPPAGHVAE